MARTSSSLFLLFFCLALILELQVVLSVSVSVLVSEEEEDPLKSAETLARTAYQKVAEQQLPVLSKAEDPRAYPAVGDPFSEKWRSNRREAWTSGFMSGCFWRLSQLNVSETKWKSMAEEALQGLWPMQHWNESHDVGFVIFTSFGNAFINTHNSSYISPLRNAAEALASRFSPTVGCTRSWNKNPSDPSPPKARRQEFLVIIDNMMNLELLFWVANFTGDRNLSAKAISHAKRTISSHIREDGSTWQVVSFNESNGEILSRFTVQGLRNDSTWARGQAWAIYGFAMAYRYTLIREFLETAMKTADFFMRNAPSDDKVPFWDFDANTKGSSYVPRDSSAAAIAASGILELSQFVGMKAGAVYRDFAVELLRNLAHIKYRADGNPTYKIPAILVNGTGHRSRRSFDTALIFGDYYFLDALFRLQEISILS